MACSVRSSPYAFPVEVARFLAVEPRDVKAMIELDGLPTTKIPKKTRKVDRIYLPDFHAWLVNRSKNAADRLRDYKAWLAEFDAIARISPETETLIPE